jgi:UDP-3-O-[3-hydroxymyristoyl] glucosamine N-acyltransferase
MSERSLFTLAQLAEAVGGRVVGDPAAQISALATLATAGSGQLSFFANPRYIEQLRNSKAQAVLVTQTHLDEVPGDAVVVDDPYLAFARLSHLFDWRSHSGGHIHPRALIDESAEIAEGVSIGPGVVIGARVVILEGVSIGANSVIGDDCRIGTDSRIEPLVSLYPNVHLGERVIVHSQAVLGGDGFGFARDRETWVKICQLGGVRIGNDVEIGSGVTIDRGALEDTVIADGVKLDNQIQIAHNVRVGEHTAIAGCTAIAGSTKIGRHCTIAGMSGVTGHLDIADGTHITAMSLVSRSITEPGAYSSGTGLEPHRQWKRNVARFRQLDDMAKRLRKLEQAFEHLSTKGQNDDGC